MIAYNSKNSPLSLANDIGCYLGLIGCCVILFSYCRYPLLRVSLSNQLIILQTFCIFIDNVSLVFCPIHYEISCDISGAVHQYFWVASILWACVIQYILINLTLAPVTKVATYQPSLYMQQYHAICWIASIPLAIIPLATGSIQSNGLWCSVGITKTVGVAVRGAHFTLLWICFAYITMSSFYIYRKLQDVLGDGSDRQTTISKSLVASNGSNNNIRTSLISTRNTSTSYNNNSSKYTHVLSTRLILYPIGLMAVHILITIYRYWELFGTTEPPIQLEVAGIAILRVHGMLNLLIFSSQQSVRECWYADFMLITNFFGGRESDAMDTDLNLFEDSRKTDKSRESAFLNDHKDTSNNKGVSMS